MGRLPIAMLLSIVVLGVFAVLRSAVAGALPGAGLTLSPDHGPAGTPVAVAGQGLGACRNSGGGVQLVWDDGHS